MRAFMLSTCLLLLLPLTASAASAQQAAKAKVSAPFIFAGGPGNQQDPVLGGNTLVYTECKSGDCDIYGVDLSTRQGSAISGQVWDETQPSTDGVRVVWRDGRDVDPTYSKSDNETSNFDLYGTYLGNRQGFTVSRSSQAQSKPYVWGNTIVWSDFRDASTDTDQTAGKIYMMDIPTGKEVRVSKTNSPQVRPVTNGNVVVWVDYRNEPDPNGKNADIYGYDLNTGQEFAISTAPDTQTSPAISGNIVVWADYRKGDDTSDIYGYDLTTHKEFPITTAPGSQIEPAISGNIVVWTDYRNDPQGTNSDIYGYDLSTHQEFAVTLAPGMQHSPTVSGNTFAWVDEAKGNQDRDVVGATISGIATQPVRQGPPVLPGNGSQRFAQTGQEVSGVFNDYWNSHGGLQQQGYPISGVERETSPLDGKQYTVQYFERAVFEYHPEQKAPYNVLLSQLGTFRYKQKYPAGALAQAIDVSLGAQVFTQTGHTVGGVFLLFWQQHGGLQQQGYPISDEFTETSDLDGQPYLVQYFERAVFELHPTNPPPYNVLLSQLGRFQLEHK